MKSLTRIILGGILASGGCSEKNIPPETTRSIVPATKNSVSTTQITESKRAEDYFIFPGTFNFDADTNSFDYNKKDFEKSRPSRLRRFSLWEIKEGAKTQDCDFQYIHESRTKRALVPINGAGLADITHVDDEKINEVFLRDLVYSKNSVRGDDEDNHILPGTKLAFRTNEGNFGYFSFSGFLPYGEDENRIKNYDLCGKITIFKK